jgi:CHAT domain-containing protein
MSDERFIDIDLSFAKIAGVYEPRVRSMVGEEVGVHFSAKDLHLGKSGHLAARQEVGAQLYEAAFGGGAGELFERSRSLAAERGRKLRLRLHLAGKLADLPWEYLYDAASGTFLSLEGAVVRTVELAGKQSERLSRSLPLRILALRPSSDDQETAKDLGETLAGFVGSEQVVLDWLTGPSGAELSKQLLGGDYGVIHLAGHGHLGLELADLDLESPRLAVLEGEQEPSSAPLSTAAESLIRGGLSAVVTSPLRAGRGAARFNQGFYQSLVAGRTVESAVAEGRRALYADQRDEVDWGAPMVYTQSAEESLPEPVAEDHTVVTGGGRNRVYSVGGRNIVPGEEGGGGGNPPPPGGPPPGGGGGGGNPPPPSRFLQGRFPERVRRGDTVTLLARIALEPAGERSARVKEINIPPGGLDASLVVTAPGFEIQGYDRCPVKIPANMDSDWVHFALKAVESGVHTAEVLAFAGASYLGSLTLQTIVDDAVTTGERQEHGQKLRSRLEGEITVRIRYDADAKVYRFQLIDDSPLVAEEVPSDRLQQTPVVAINDLVKEINEIARGSSPFRSARQTQTWLRNKGIELWRQFIPEPLQRQFWELSGRIQRILILSDKRGDPVPWEILYPFRPGNGNDGGFLAERFLITRWITGVRPPASSLRLDSAAFVQPFEDEAPANAPAEIAAIRRLLKQRGMRVTEPIEDLGLLSELLHTGGFNLLHFACHNAYASLEIKIGGEPFQPTLLQEHQGQFVGAAPLVFINACRSDGQVPQYTALEGWARAFLDTGAGAFVGTLWEVRDETASLFAQEFYSKLSEPGVAPCTLGEALQAGRRKISDQPGDPTWLAYTVYGDSAATLIRSAP